MYFLFFFTQYFLSFICMQPQLYSEYFKFFIYARTAIRFCWI
ncbi:hypothetical protein RchiOBHm_Chr4g0400801 [Rosa chinensis]|uniref:Uncharacterized protein n=1 Tax=Rosa chinensis TaxID=74649 RepID=A0A2P6QSZ5_ROSCH|nr:hypothetical protein RchiOBHm_Chr4g0400801 [Rosa chinensis]